jgi:hypothetical protein
MRRVIEECQSGVLARAGDAESLASSVHDLLSDEGRRREMGSNGQRAVLRKYHWGEDERRMLEAVDPGRRLIPRVPATPSVESALRG